MLAEPIAYEPDAGSRPLGSLILIDEPSAETMAAGMIR